MQLDKLVQLYSLIEMKERTHTVLFFKNNILCNDQPPAKNV